MRCVEAWSMVIPWVGFPLGDLIKRFAPTSRAKYVAFKTVLRPAEMPGPALPGPRLAVRRRVAHRRSHAPAHDPRGRALWPDAAEPERRAAAAGRAVEIRLQGHQVDRRDPLHRAAAPHDLEHHGAAGVRLFREREPGVDHPRWSQAQERRIGAGLFAAKQPTLPFNGYAEQVASLYRGMDLKRYLLIARRSPPGCASTSRSRSCCARCRSRGSPRARSTWPGSASGPIPSRR